MKTTIRVKKIGENTDYFREYYKGVDNSRFYTRTEFRGKVEWHTTSCNGGEPGCPVSKELEFEIVEA